MSAMYWVTFDDGTALTIHAADARSFKRKDVRAAYVNARKRATVRRRKVNPKARAVSVRCVG